jgi:crotonobetainyl-CoA:carnitine CoA-transferase CaiB-like acyl-CoA transferase
VVDNFSPRVRPNLGIAPDDLRRRRAELVDVSITAFPPTAPEAGWIAYGGGVHAASGLAEAGGGFRAAPLAYPDPLAGFTALATILDALARGRPGHHALSLADAIAPLLARAPAPAPAAAATPAPPGVAPTEQPLPLQWVDGCRVPPAPLRRAPEGGPR